MKKEDMNFDNFIVTKENEFTFEVVKSMLNFSKKCSCIYPIFLWNNKSEKEKIHLLNAIENEVKENKKIYRKSCEEIYNTYYNIKEKKEQCIELRNQILKNDVFIIENFEYIIGKPDFIEFMYILTKFINAEETKRTIIVSKISYEELGNDKLDIYYDILSRFFIIVEI